MINLAVVGYGYWGPNIVRNVMERAELSMWGLCELDPDRSAKFSSRYPGVHTCADFDEMLADPAVDAVVDRYAAVDALPTGAQGAGGRQARAGREAAGHDRGPRRRSWWSWPTAAAWC